MAHQRACTCSLLGWLASPRTDLYRPQQPHATPHQAKQNTLDCHTHHGTCTCTPHSADSERAVANVKASLKVKYRPCHASLAWSSTPFAPIQCTHRPLCRKRPVGNLSKTVGCIVGASVRPMRPLSASVCALHYMLHVTVRMRSPVSASKRRQLRPLMPSLSPPAGSRQHQYASGCGHN